MTTTIETVTDSQIQTLRREALSAGDVVMVAVCDIALGCDASTLPDELDMTRAQRDHLERLGLDSHPDYDIHEAARAECVRVIADAEAQR